MQLVQKVRKKLKEKGEEEKKDDDRKKGKEKMKIRKKVVSVKRRGIDEWRGGEIKWVERGGGGGEGKGHYGTRKRRKKRGRPSAFSCHENRLATAGQEAVNETESKKRTTKGKNVKKRSSGSYWVLFNIIAEKR